MGPAEKSGTGCGGRGILGGAAARCKRNETLRSHLLTDLKAHDGKCMACDFGPNLDDGVLAPSGYDRTFKLWAGGDDGLGGYR